MTEVLEWSDKNLKTAMKKWLNEPLHPQLKHKKIKNNNEEIQCWKINWLYEDKLNRNLRLKNRTNAIKTLIYRLNSRMEETD